MSTTWLTSDTHLSHLKVAQIRGFDNVQDHDAHIIRNINKLVQPDDTLWILGDVAMGGWKTSIVQFLPLVSDGITIHVVLGNHDRPHPSMSSAHNHVKEFTLLGGFMTVQTMASINHGGTSFMMSHFPYSGDTDGRPEDRFEKYRLRDEGIPLFHGHTHSNEKVSFSDKGTKQIHVGLDAWDLKPVRIADAVKV